MKIAIVGGTHGNEPVGVGVIQALQSQKFKSLYPIAKNKVIALLDSVKQSLAI